MNSSYSTDWLMAHQHLGPAIIGEDAAAQVAAMAKTTDHGRFGPAIVGDVSVPAMPATPGKAPKTTKAPKTNG